MIRQGSPSSRPRRRAQPRASIVLELLMALPVMVLAMDVVVTITFDAAFMTSMSVATIEAAREAGYVFARGVPLTDPHGEPEFDPRDGDDVADRVALIVERRLRMLRLRVVPTERPGVASDLPGVRVVVRHRGQVAERGNRMIPLRASASAPLPDELELVVAVRMSKRSFSSSKSTAESNESRSWLGSNVLQCSARVPLE